jgi:hypothetical protein
MRNVFPVRYVPEDGILHSYRRENLRPYITHNLVVISRRHGWKCPHYDLILRRCERHGDSPKNKSGSAGRPPLKGNQTGQRLMAQSGCNPQATSEGQHRKETNLK